MINSHCSHLSVLIVGGGIAGLSAAIGLKQKGLSVKVLERHSSCHALGAPLRIGPNATRVLISYGLRDILSAIDTNAPAAVLRRYEDGRYLLKTESHDMLDTFGAPMWTMSRFKLQEALGAQAEAMGVEMMWGCEVDRIDTETPFVQLRGGEILGADFIIGADGVTSVIRQQMIGPIKSISPLTLYNVDVPIDLVRENPKTREVLEEQSLWLGPHCLVAQMNMPDHKNVVNLALAHERLQGGAEGEWLTSGNLNKVRDAFSNFSEPITELLSMAPMENCYLWKLSELPTLNTWRKSGKVVLVGDAAHAMLPYTGQGAGMAIEDSGCLSECFAKVASTDDIATALASFEAIRKPRCEWVKLRGSAFQLPMLHLPDGPAQEERDRSYASMSTGLASASVPWTIEMLDEPPCPAEEGGHPLAAIYSYGYDVLEHTRRYLLTSTTQ